jgi:hypothetical protein
MSLDRGAHWERLRLGMPPVSVHDLRIQPQTGDLIAATHGRGIFILDDLGPMEGLAAARAGGVPVLFPIRPAYAWYYWWRTQYGMWDTSCCSPAGTFSAPDPPYGALISYYLPHPARAAPRIYMYDRDGRLIRSVTGSNKSGLNRVSWDLAGAPPIAWARTGSWNQGAADGPQVAPGAYTAELVVDGRRLREPVSVLADPRATWTQADYESRYSFLKELDEELSAIDAALNRLDALRARASRPLLAAIDTMYHQFTSDVQNSEDDQWMPDRLRERLTILQGDVALSQGPPLPPHQREAAAIRSEFDAAMAAYRRFLTHWNIEEKQ